MGELFLLPAHFVGEFFLQALFEGFAWLIDAMLRKIFGMTEPASPIANGVVSIGFGFLGAIASLYLVPEVAIRNHTFQIFNLALSPLMFGFLVGLMHKKKNVLTEMSFGVVVSAALFAFVFTLTRWVFGK